MKLIYKQILAISSLISMSIAHVEMQQPAPRKSQFNRGYGGSPDYNMNSPLGAYPCKGYGKGPSVQTVQAGSPISVKLLGQATHNGGHCQFSLSYDNGNTFVVIKTIMGECLRKDGYDYSVKIPKEAPNGDVIFAWSWINRTGNREFYMNCADITINGSSSNSLSGPEMMIANLPGKPTIPEFTDGGYDGSDLFKNCPSVTVTGNGISSSSNNSQSGNNASSDGNSSNQNGYAQQQSSPQNGYAQQQSSPQNGYAQQQPPSQNNYSQQPVPVQSSYGQVQAPSSQTNNGATVGTPVYSAIAPSSVDYNIINYPTNY